MRFKLYQGSTNIGQFTDFEEAEAASRWSYFLSHNAPWEGERMPPKFVIMCVNDDLINRT